MSSSFGRRVVCTAMELAKKKKEKKKIEGGRAV
jgi:hypothetical protein